MRNLLILVVLLLWALLGYKMCTDWKECCADNIGSEVSTEGPAASSADEVVAATCPDVPICFLSNSCEGSFGSRFNAIIDSVIAGVGTGQKLRIIGIYNSAESNSSGFADLGLCRADAVRKAIGARLADDRIELGAQRAVGQSGNDTGFSTDLIRFDIVGEEEAPLATGTLIYFPFASTSQIRDPAVEAYLRQVAAAIGDSGQRIRLTGHTDDIGEEAANMRLGRQRAIVIRDYLVSIGVPASKIIVQSLGETQPVASNATERGRAQNRRTELQLIQ